MRYRQILPVARIAEAAMRGYLESSGRALEVEYYIDYVDDNNAIIAFRGTETKKLWKGGGWRDVLRNAMVWRHNDPRLPVGHAGFITGAIRAVDKNIVPELVDAGYRDATITVTGHSLGGGVSLPAAELLRYAGFHVNQWVGFGTPKVYSTHVRSFPFAVTSYRHKNDRVTQLPFACLGFTHQVPLTQIGPSHGKRGTWDDHSMEQYLLRLR